MTDNLEAETVGDAIDGNIVVRRSDAAAGENVIESFGKLSDLAADDLDLILDRRDFLYLNAEPAQLGAEKIGVSVAGLARQNFVADDHDAGGFRHASFFTLLDLG